jgi:phage-related protein
MEALLYQFTLLSNQACQDKNYDPSSTDDLMKLFEIEAYKSWVAMELEQDMEVKEAEVAMQQAEDYLDSDMESAMDEFRRFEVEMERMAMSELESLERTAESARKMGNLLEKAATFASKKYMEAALNSATASMKTAWKGLSSKKVHPS